LNTKDLLMNVLRMFRVALASAAVLLGTNAFANTITFTGRSTDGDPLPATFDGFSWSQVSTVSCGVAGGLTGYCFGQNPGDTGNIVAYLTLTPPAPGSTGSITWIPETDAPYFKLLSADLAAFKSGGEIVVEGTGILGSFSQVFNAGVSRIQADFGWDGLTQVTIRSTRNDNPWVLDNFKYEVSAVPEPSTWAMMGLGLLGLAAVRLRRRS
jgi:hypothetical protein